MIQHSPDSYSSEFDRQYYERLYPNEASRRGLRSHQIGDFGDRYLPRISDLAHYNLLQPAEPPASDPLSNYQVALKKVLLASSQTDGVPSVLSYGPYKPQPLPPATALSPLEGLLPEQREAPPSSIASLSKTDALKVERVADEVYRQPITAAGSTLIAAVGCDIIAHNLATGEKKTLFEEPDFRDIKAVLALTEDSFIACSGRSVNVNSVHFISPNGTFTAHEVLRDEPCCLAQAGPFYLIGQRDGTLSILSGPRNGQAPKRARSAKKVHEGAICSITVSPYRDSDGNIVLATGGEDKRIVIHHICPKSGKRISTSEHSLHDDAVTGLQFHPSENSTIASSGGSNDRKVKIWNWETGRVYHEEEAPVDFTALTWTKHGDSLAIATGYHVSQLGVYRYGTSKINPHTLQAHANTPVLDRENTGIRGSAPFPERYVAMTVVPKTGQIAALNTKKILECYELPKAPGKPNKMNIR